MLVLNMLVNKVSLFFVGIFLSINVFSQRINVTPNQDEILISLPELEVYKDTTNSIRFEQFRSGNFNAELFTSSENADYDPSSSYWIKLDLNFPENDRKFWLLEFYDQTIDTIEAYIPNSNGSYRKVIMGDHLPFSQKTLRHKNFEIFIQEDLPQKQTYYFKVRSRYYADMHIAIRSFQRFVHYSLFEYFLYGIFYGTIIIISLYNILVFFAIREIKYLYYTFYILSVGIYALCIDGIAYQFLWPNASEWNQYAYGPALFSLIFWSILFGQQFLKTSVRTPVFHKIINYSLLARVFIFIIALIFNKQLFEWRSIEIIPLSLIFIAGIFTFLRGYKPARFFVIAYGILFLGFIMKALISVGVIPFTIVSYYSLHIAFLLEMLFLTFALSDRIRILKDIRDKAVKRIMVQHHENVKLKDKVNKELEELVDKRTQQLREKNILLEETNQKLNQKTVEIGRINSLLDLDNWKLKNNIKEILQDRLINKNLTYEEFRKIFPDEVSCYRFLTRLKWDQGYGCARCGHNHYSDGKTKFSRRCSRCGYDESVTSNTVFHRLRMPIEKAFYILYVTNNRQSRYTIDELSETLQLRRNTVWNFKKKVEESFNKKDEEQLFVTDLFSQHFLKSRA